MSVRAKFKVNSIGHFEGGHRKVEMTPVYGDSPENKAFWTASPNGKLDLYITNPEASSQFEVGKSYYIDFTLAE